MLKFPYKISSEILFSSLLEDYPKVDCTGLGIPQAYTPNDIVFVFRQAELRMMIEAPALLIVDADIERDTFSIPCIVVKHARILLKKLLDRTETIFFELSLKKIYAQSTIDPSVKLGSDVAIDPRVVIESGCVIGNRVRLAAGVHIQQNCFLEDDVEIGSNTVLYPRVRVGQRTKIYASSVIGMPGFGFEHMEGRWQRLPHLSGVEIGEDCFIGSHVSIAAGVLQPTVLHNNVIVDNQVQIAHHVEIGNGTAIAGCVGIAGSTKIGKHCLIGGGVGIAGHLTLTDHVTITGMTMVTKSIFQAGVYSSGMPVDDNKSWKKKMVYLAKLPTLFKDFYQGNKKKHDQYEPNN